MRLSFKPNITCSPTRNLWFVNVFSRFKRQNSVVKKWQLVKGPLAAGAPSHGTTGTMVNPLLPARSEGALQVPQRGSGRSPGRKSIISIFGIQETCLMASTLAIFVETKMFTKSQKQY